MNMRDEYVAKMKAKLDEWKAQIDELEAKARRAKAQAAQKHQERITELKGKRDEAQEKLEEIQGAGEDAWESLKSGAEQVWENVTTILQKARTPSSRGCKTISNHFPTRP